MVDIKDIFDSFEPKSIGDLFKENKFIVPPNQRIYSWEKENWQEFWEDILDTIIQKDLAYGNPFYEYHFFGPMFFIPMKDGKFRILDGQQRLVTSSICLRVIYDIITLMLKKGTLSKEEAALIGKIEERLFYFENKNKFDRITLGERNRIFYNKIITNDETPINKINNLNKYADSKTNKEILKCYKFFLNSTVLYKKGQKTTSTDLRKIEDDALNKFIEKEISQKFLISLYESIVDRLYVLLTVVPSSDIIYEMFETLNQRGEKLLQVDLFKNFLFDRFGSFVGVEKIENFWEELINITDEEKNLKFFLRHFWLSNYEFVREKKLFKSIKKKVDTIDLSEQGFEDFKKHILNEALVYFALGDPNNSMWADKSELAQLIDEINYLGFTQIFPLFLIAHIKCYKDEIKVFQKIIRTFLSFAVRRYTIMGESPSEYEEDYSLWARKLRSNEMTIEEIIGILEERTPSNKDIELRLQGLEIGERKGKYLVIKINDSIISDPLMCVWRNNPTLEHVIPKNPDNWWNDHLQKNNLLHRNVVNRFGNYTILNPPLNSSLGVKKYDVKQNTYLKTGLPINKMFEGLDNFDIKAIEKREKLMSDIIIKNKIFGNKS
jgi:uncharacterized protein with ParB-like and HNH nuclease domain